MKRKNLFIVFLSLVMLIIIPVSSLADDIVVAFEKKEYTALVGKDVSIVPVVQGTKQKGKMEYVSSDESIATVRNGKVKGNKAGTVTITCKAVIGDETFECSYELTVLQPVKKIEVQSKTIELPSNCKMREPFIHVLPEDASNPVLEFKSSNSKVATVDNNGIISTLSEGGTATITCMSTDGSNVKASFTVKVPKTAWFFEKSYEVNDPDGIDFYYKPTANHFLSKELWSSDLFHANCSEAEVKDISDDLPYVFKSSSNPLIKVHITPRKAGKGKFTYDGFMVSKVSVNITVNRSAVYEDLNYDQCMKNTDKNTGLRFRISGNYLNEESQDGIRSLYLACNGDVTKPVKVILTQNNNNDYSSRTTITLKGKLSGLTDFVTETGLKKQILVIEAE